MTIIWSERIYLFEYKYIPFSYVATRLSRPAEPSQQVCSLQSAGLPSLVGTPCNRTTTTCLVVRLYTLELYDHTPYSRTTVTL